MISIAKPLANENTEKRIQKLIKEAKKSKTIKRGTKATTSSILEGNYGLVVLAGNVTPIDLISHIPPLCEEKRIPYIFVRNKDILSIASEKGNSSSCCYIPIIKENIDERIEKILKCAKVEGF